ncbi:MAG: hypothetical protein Solumvirus3_37 [Solumvirus sp.]|uniref:alpha-L-fucosidase n=1 Tax=Solumvirus sp. TaxID=2487773 RepID=A0A3G5AJ13_9VIRU|nr:MAG: hypothetical protein Solumvirus3_37 [Solumvirus sp.]
MSAASGSLNKITIKISNNTIVNTDGKDQKNVKTPEEDKKTSIGVIFHWGLYSVPAFDDIKSAKRRKIQNGSEWYLKRLVEKGEYRPITGWKETQTYHQKHYGTKKYEDFAADFKAEKFYSDSDVNAGSVNEWMNTAKSIGATYVILTSKHHDGFCLWPTKTTNYNSMETGAKKDLLGIFRDAARRHGLKFGIYYSWSEFGFGVTKEYITKKMVPQVTELMTYNPDIWWFDGHWECKTKYSKDEISKLLDLMKTKNPNVEINDRVADPKVKEDINYLGKSTYRVYGDREIPKVKPNVKWEHINTIGYSWGRNKEQNISHYKSAENLYKIYQDVRALNGNFLINIGPNSDGTICNEETNVLLKFGTLLKQ